MSSKTLLCAAVGSLFLTSLLLTMHIWYSIRLLEQLGYTVAVVTKT